MFGGSPLTRTAKYASAAALECAFHPPDSAMFTAAAITAESKPQLYAELAQQASGLLHGESNLIANAANFAALVYHALPDINWCGFYLYDGNEIGRASCRERR